MQQSISPGESSSEAKLTRALLLCSVVAGPIYVLVGVIETFTRRGYDPLRHDLSIMANGDWGWIHSSMLVLTGLLTIVGAVGMRRVLHGNRGGTWGPLLLGFYGLGLILAGVFAADPAHGFPPGTPADYNTVSWHGLLHLICGGLGFIGLIISCFIFARRFASQGVRGWRTYSIITGIFYLAAFIGIVVGSSGSGAILAFVILAFDAAVIIGWTWISVISLRLLRERSHALA